MKAILIFGCEKNFIGETKARYIKASQYYLKKNNDNEILIFTGIGSAIKMMQEALKDRRIKNIIVENHSKTTLDNLFYGLPRFYFWEEITFCSSWYHLPRILMIYYFFRKKLVTKPKIKILPVWIFTISSLKNALFEPLKCILDFLNLIGWEKPRKISIKLMKIS